MIGSLDEEAQEDLRNNKNFNTYKGAIYENVVGDMLVKQGYKLYFYKNEKGTIEMDFFVRDKDSLIPVEVKATDGATVSLNNLINSERYRDCLLYTSQYEYIYGHCQVRKILVFYVLIFYNYLNV